MTEEEVRRHLEDLGYTDLPECVLKDFMEGGFDFLQNSTLSCYFTAHRLMVTDLQQLASKGDAGAPITAADEVPQSNFSENSHIAALSWEDPHKKDLQEGGVVATPTHGRARAQYPMAPPMQAAVPLKILKMFAFPLLQLTALRTFRAFTWETRDPHAHERRESQPSSGHVPCPRSPNLV